MISTTEISPTAETPAIDARPDLLGLSREALAEALAPVIDRPFRAKQVYQALHERAVRDLSEITELPRELRERLD